MWQMSNAKLHIFIVLRSYEFSLAPIGALAPGSAHARHSAQPPIDTSRNFSAQVLPQILFQNFRDIARKPVGPIMIEEEKKLKAMVWREVLL